MLPPAVVLPLPETDWVPENLLPVFIVDFIFVTSLLISSVIIRPTIEAIPATTLNISMAVIVLSFRNLGPIHIERI
jgi:hypothetical protein